VTRCKPCSHFCCIAMFGRICSVWAIAHVGMVEGRVCAHNHEDCSHTGCCNDPGMKCYKKNNFWAGCRPSCTPGMHALDAPEHRTPWSCELIGGSHRDCAADDGDCIHLGCCKNTHHKCFMKDPGEAFCRTSRPSGWLGHEIVARHPHGDASYAPNPGAGNENWKEGLHSTHYWDCNGQGCDGSALQPWDKSRYVSPPEYAPMDPEKYGGSVYGEKIWMTGAASDAVSDILGPDANNCGSDNQGGGGCGQCIMVKNSQANRPDWNVIIMRKNRCPPWSHGCGKGGFHMDFAVPGFDNLQYSTANICGNPGTTLSKQQSAICGAVNPADCNCGQIPTHTAALRRMREGCELFKQWGWSSGTPTMKWKPVSCPQKFVEQVQLGAAFGARGPVTVSFFDNSTSLRRIGRDVANSIGSDRSWLHGHWQRATFLVLPALLVMGVFRGVGAARRWHKQPAAFEALVAGAE